MIGIKIEKDNNVIKYVSLIKSYNKSLSLGDIKKRIENDEYVIEHDLIGSFDISDDMEDIDRNKLLRDLVDKLLGLQANLKIYYNNSLITIDTLDNLLERTKQIEEETIRDIDRELGEY